MVVLVKRRILLPMYAIYEKWCSGSLLYLVKEKNIEMKAWSVES